MAPSLPTDAVLLDTDVFSYLLKENDRNAERYRRHVEGKLLCLSYVTVGELWFGARRAEWGESRIARLNESIGKTVILHSDRKVCEVYADLKAELQRTGRCPADNDLWIAACAVRHSIPLVSNNRRHFESVPHLRLISESV